MALFKILSIKLLQPEDFLLWDYARLTEQFGSPLDEDVSIRVARYQNIHKCLIPGTEYKLVNRESPSPDDFFMIKKDRKKIAIESLNNGRKFFLKLVYGTE